MQYKIIGLFRRDDVLDSLHLEISLQAYKMWFDRCTLSYFNNGRIYCEELANKIY